MTPKQKRVVVAMSGGVDSTLAAQLLLEQGYEVLGATMKHFDGADTEAAREMADFLHIPFVVIDLRKEFQEIVLDYFTHAYAAGRTPNPCVVCDFHIKFGRFMDAARAAFDADYFATGHYARILYDEDRQKYAVYKGLDLTKDQSYVMYTLTQQRLARILFPLGRLAKTDTRALSKEKGLPTHDKAESQDICFIPAGKTYKDFLEIHAPHIFKEGNLVDTRGRVLGRHKGLARYTIGQRKGLGIAAKTPLYVVALDAKRNEVIVGSNDDLFQSRLVATDLHFTDGAPPADTFRAEVKIRYGTRVHPCEVEIKNEAALVTFDEPQRAVTAGQSVVFYDGERLVGGGTIVKGKR